jgi:hypothetical protein
MDRGKDSCGTLTLSGKFEFRVGNDVIVGGPGTSAVCPRDIPHKFRNVSTGSVRLLLIFIPGHFGNFLLEGDTHDAFVRSPQNTMLRFWSDWILGRKARRRKIAR